MKADQLTRVHTIDGMRFLSRTPAVRTTGAGWVVFLDSGKRRPVERWYSIREDIKVGGYVDPAPAGGTVSRIKGEKLGFEDFSALAVSVEGARRPRKVPSAVRFSLSKGRGTGDRYCRV